MLADVGAIAAGVSPSGVAGLAQAGPLIGKAFSDALKPRPRRSAADWALDKRYVSAESGSPYPGKWSHDIAPYSIEIMEVCSLSDPITEVWIKKAAQLGITEALLNVLGQICSETPTAVLITLQSIEALKEYGKLKLQPMIDATPAVREKVREQKSRDEDGSTSTMKMFPGGYLLLTTAASSRGLQMKTVRVTINEEVSEYPHDVDGRGDPLDLADARTDAWSGREKKIRNSTPGSKGECRITRGEAASDQRRYFVPCPHCGDLQQLHWERLIKEGGDKGLYPCASCGVLIHDRDKPGMLLGGTWLKCYPGDGCPPPIVGPDMVARYRRRDSDGRSAGFWLNGLYSPFKSWLKLIGEWEKAQGIPSKEKAFANQGLGEEYADVVESADPQRLLDRREDFAPRCVPIGCVRITAAADVQGDRLQYGVYAWGIGYAAWRIDGGVIVGNPNDESTWRELDKVLDRRYPDVWDRPWQIDAFGVDTGYLTNRAYAWARRHASTRRVFALDGRGGWKLPPLGVPSKRGVTIDGRRIGKVLLWPVGTWDMKSELYAALRKTADGPDAAGIWPVGAAHFGNDCDLEFFKQLTAEHLKTKELPSGLAQQRWIKDASQANEEHDIAVYARALVHHLTDSWSPEHWLREAARLGQPPEEAQQDLLRWLQPPLPAVKAPPGTGDQEGDGMPQRPEPTDTTLQKPAPGPVATPKAPPVVVPPPAPEPINARKLVLKRRFARSGYMS